MSNYKVENLPSGLILTTPHHEKDFFLLEDELRSILLSKEDIARMYGIAFPEKKHGCCMLDIGNKLPELLNNNLKQKP